MSKVEIINRALLKLGEPPVSSLNDAAFGKSYETIYEDVKKPVAVVISVAVCGRGQASGAERKNVWRQVYVSAAGGLSAAA